MIQWKDISSYSQSDTKRIPNTFALKAGCVRITVHQYFGLGDAWFVTCHEVGMNVRDLHTKDADEAKRIAVEMVRTRLQEALSKLNEGGE